MFRLKPLPHFSAVALSLLMLSSCGGGERPASHITPPVSILQPAAEPPMSERSLESEEAYEADRTAKIEWGRSLREQMNRACLWFRDAGVKLECTK